MSEKDHRESAIDLPKSYDQDIAMKLPLSWEWDKRNYDSLPYIFTFSIAVTALNCKVGDLVLDFACGSGWISEWLNRLGIRTVSMDISDTLLNFSRKRMTLDSRINLEDVPAYFVAGEGDMFPFADETFDGIICMNSLHHMPDYQLVFNEMFRVLKKKGRASFAEPGSAHSNGPLSVAEVNSSGVLEKDVILADVYAMALNAGFSNLTLKPYMHPLKLDYTYFDWQRLLNKMPSAVDAHITHLTEYVETANLLFTLHKGTGGAVLDSRMPGILAADIEAVDMSGLQDVMGGAVASVIIRVKNTGDTLWLSAKTRYGGDVCLSAIILGADDREAGGDFMTRYLLPRDVAPDETVDIEVKIKAPAEKGRYRIKFDLVCERICWFEAAGSKTLILDIVVI